MSEDLLRNLMQLFAILAKLDTGGKTARDTIHTFLREQLSLEDHENWLLLFDEFLAAHRARQAQKGDLGKSKLSVRDSSRLLLICTQINTELTQRQKMMVLFILFSLIKPEDNQFEEQEQEFLIAVADIFNISQKEFRQVEGFALGKDPSDEDVQDLILISNQTMGQQDTVVTKTKHIYSQEVDEGHIAVLRMAAIGLYLVRYTGSQQSVYLNGVAMRQNRIYSLDTGSSLHSHTSKGHEKPIYYSDIVSKFMEDEGIDRITFEAKDLVYKFPNGRIGLHEFNMLEESGHMIGLMGPSGAGKSTLLEVLNGNLRPSEGQILINGRNLYENKDSFKGLIGYVPQDDLLIEELSVFQNLYFAARLCYGTFGEEQLTKVVDRTLESLGLSHIRDLRVGSPMAKTISGGERKRVNIGLELLRAPQVLFVDEPTSGLSSRDSVNVMELLKELSEQGKLVFVVIHQPSSDIYKMFDKLVILDTGGYPVYQGNPVEAIRYFKARTSQVNRDQALCHDCGNVNPEQIFDIMETRVVNEFGRFTGQRRYSPEWWNEQYHRFMPKTNIRRRTAEIVAEFRKAGIWRQLSTFVERDVLSKLHNRQYLIINLVEAPALAILLAWVFKYYKVDELTTQGYVFRENDNIPVYLFISIIVALFLGLTVSAEEIFRDRKILKRERFLHLSRNAYLTSKVMILFTISAVQSILFVLIGNEILEIRHLSMAHWAVLFSTACFANMLGLNVSSAFNSAITIYILIPILLIPQLVLGGIVIKFDQINPVLRRGESVPAYGEIMASRWAFEALMVSQYKENPHEKPLYNWDMQIAQADFKKVYLLPTLEGKVEYCDHNSETRDISVIHQIDKELEIINRQLQEERRSTGLHLRIPRMLDYKTYSPAVSNRLRKLIHDLTTHYNDRFNESYRNKDAFVQDRTNTPAEATGYVDQSKKFTNQAVEDLVKNTRSQDRIVQEGNKLIQKAYPIYDLPDDRVSYIDFRTHFYAPMKRFMGHNFDTLWFNLGIIWAMCALLYIMLYYNMLSRLIGLISGYRR